MEGIRNVYSSLVGKEQQSLLEMNSYLRFI
jgi:hypothetical protein